MKEYYLSIDIGASSGRHMLIGLEQGGLLTMEEIYRFTNGLKKKNGSLCWDHTNLFQQILTGLKRCKELNKIPVTVGIDTWGVDFVLLDKEGEVVGNTVSYRDSRTKGMKEAVESVISKERLYEITGIGQGEINTIYQLMALKREEPELLSQAEHFLMTPDYFYYQLTDEFASEYTISSTSSLVNGKTRNWDFGLIKTLGLPTTIFHDISMAGTKTHPFSEKVSREVGYQSTVVLSASHDTASAVLAVKAREKDFLYISSGTWSLLGIETEEFRGDEESRQAGFTNEGGVWGTYRYLKNIMGLWMIQQVRSELEDKYSFAQLCQMASDVGDPFAFVDVNDPCFMAPENMIAAIQSYCRNQKSKVPETPGEIANVIYHSLAKYYKESIVNLEHLTKKTYDTIYIVGGGSNATYLNDLTAQYTGKKVVVGPSEATAIGNALTQMIAVGKVKDTRDARALVRSM